MRILQVGPIPPEVGGRTTGGLATHVWELSTHLAKRGHEVAILADNLPNPEKAPVIKEEVRIYGLSRKHIREFLPLASFELPKIIKLWNYVGRPLNVKGIVTNALFYKFVFIKFKPEIVHVHGPNRFPYVHFMLQREIPKLITIHSFTPAKFELLNKQANSLGLIPKNLRRVNNLILNSKLVERQLKKFCEEYEGNYRVIFDPVDITKYYPLDRKIARQKLGLPEGIPIILFVGNLFKIKGEYILLQASKILKDEGVSLRVIIVGDGPETSGVEDFAAKNGIEDIVRIEGFRQYPELLYYYNSADLFVMPSFSEGFGIVYLEALLCGIPVIGVKGVADDAIPSEDYGFLAPPGNARALAEAIKRGLSKEWDKEKMVGYARSFDWDKRIVEFERVYEEVKTKQ